VRRLGASSGAAHGFIRLGWAVSFAGAPDV